MSHTKVWFLFIFCYLVSLLEINSIGLNDFNEIDFQRKSELVFVHVIYRHGDRSPTKQNPGDPYDISYWKDGWGQLTELGKKQQYDLGRWLRRRYENFISQIYDLDEIYIQSSDVDRTLMSAQSNLNGLYPPKGYQRHPFLTWQPIPVHTKPVDTDYLIASSVPSNCSSYQKAFIKYYQSPKMTNLQQQAKPLFDYISAKMGVTVNDLVNLTLIRDAWVCETAHNLPLPKWATKLFLDSEEFYNAALVSYHMYTGTPYLAKYFTGFLLKDILDRLTSKVAKNLSPDRKFWVYSSHDSNVFSFMKTLGISDNKFVNYAAVIVLELRSYGNEYYVQIFYRNDSNPNPKPINIPGCGIACPLKKMYEIYDNIIPKNPPSIECTLDE